MSEDQSVEDAERSTANESITSGVVSIASVGEATPIASGGEQIDATSVDQNHARDGALPEPADTSSTGETTAAPDPTSTDKNFGNQDPSAGASASVQDAPALDKKAAKAKEKAERKAREQALSLPPPPWLTGDELVSRLRLNSDDLIKQVFEATLRQIATEDTREGRLDTKAQGLIGTAGLSLTVAFTFGGFLVQNPQYVGGGNVRPVLLCIFYAMALAAGLASTSFAIHALWVRGTKGVAERDVFNEQELLAGDWKEGGGVERYKRFLIAHLWQVFQTHADNNARKAGAVRRGQRCFVAFLMSLLLIGAVMVQAAFHRLKNPPKEESAAAMSQPVSSPHVAKGVDDSAATSSQGTKEIVMTAPGGQPPSLPAPQQAPAPQLPPRPPATSIPSGGAPLQKGDPPSTPISGPHPGGAKR